MSARCGSFRLLLVVVCVLGGATMVFGQNCAESGRYCLDDKACCGGCCRNNMCIDMYESCMVYDDLCLDNYCPPGLVCYVFKPDCRGCSPTAECRRP